MTDQGSTTPPGEPPGRASYTPEPDPPAPVRVCPNCSAQERTSGAFCPHCGTPYQRKRKRFGRRGKIIAGAVVALLVLGGAGVGVALKLDHDDQVKKRRAAEAQRADDLRQQKADAAKRKEQEETIEQSLRRKLVRALQKSITKDAQKRVTEGTLEGPVLSTSCNPAGGSDPKDLTTNTGEFECLAVTDFNDDGSASGYRFSANVDYTDDSYTWHLGG